MTLVVNMVGGPGSGKSTAAAGTFYELKNRGVNCELATEYAKDLVWEGRLNVLANQIYIFGKQYHRLWRLQEKVDVIVTDCPLFLSLYYGTDMSDNFYKLVRETFNSMENMSFFLRRLKPYNPAGRVQSEDKAKEIDSILLDIMYNNCIPFRYLDSDRSAPEIIADLVVERLGYDNR